MIILNFEMQGHVNCGWNYFSLYITILSLKSFQLFRSFFILPSCSLLYIYENEKKMIGMTLDCNGIHDTPKILRYGNIILVGFTKVCTHTMYMPHIYLSNK